MRGLLDSVRAKVSTVAVAQLVESQIVILVVVGSSPIGHPKFKQKAQSSDWAFCFLQVPVSAIDHCRM